MRKNCIIYVLWFIFLLGSVASANEMYQYEIRDVSYDTVSTGTKVDVSFAEVKWVLRLELDEKREVTHAVWKGTRGINELEIRIAPHLTSVMNLHAKDQIIFLSKSVSELSQGKWHFSGVVFYGLGPSNQE